MTLDELIITWTLNGEPTELVAFGAIEIDVTSVVTGRAYAETSYSPAERPSVDLVSVKLANPVAMYDENMRLVIVLPAGTEIGNELSDSQVQMIVNDELDAVAA